MKGLIDTFWTFVVFALAVVVFGVLLVITISQFTAGQIRFSFDYVDLTNKPYSVGEVLTHRVMNDRQFLEQSLETLITGSSLQPTEDSEKAFEKSKTEEMITQTEEFMRLYDFGDWSVGLRRGEEGDMEYKEFMKIGRLQDRCGENNRGYCDVYYGGPGGGKCGKSLRLIEGECHFPLVCCEEVRGRVDDTGNLVLNAQGEIEIVSGIDGAYIDVDDRGTTDIADDKALNILLKCGKGATTGVCDKKMNRCPYNRYWVEQDGPECTFGMSCCRSLTEEDYMKMYAAYYAHASIPILYKKDSNNPDGILGYVDVTIGR